MCPRDPEGCAPTVRSYQRILSQRARTHPRSCPRSASGRSLTALASILGPLVPCYVGTGSILTRLADSVSQGAPTHKIC